jgi:hypothetical protein
MFDKKKNFSFLHKFPFILNSRDPFCSVENKTDGSKKTIYLE